MLRNNAAPVPTAGSRLGAGRKHIFDFSEEPCFSASGHGRQQAVGACDRLQLGPLVRSKNVKNTPSLSEPQSCWQLISNRRCSCPMREVCSLIWLALVGAFRSQASLEAENMILRHQQNGHAERLIDSIRRECLDHVVVFRERHLRHVLLSSMEKDAPVPRVVEQAGHILCCPVLGGLHHQYVRT